MPTRSKSTDRQVLVVEDEYFVAIEVVDALKKKGIKTIGPARTAREALDWLRKDKVDAAVLDINLGGESVFPLADALEERKVPFVFATGYGAQAIPARYTHVRRFEKPLDLDQLVRSVAAQDRQ